MTVKSFYPKVYSFSVVGSLSNEYRNISYSLYQRPKDRDTPNETPMYLLCRTWFPCFVKLWCRTKRVFTDLQFGDLLITGKRNFL